MTLERPELVRAGARLPLMRPPVSSSASVDALDLADRQLEEARAHLAELLRVAGRQEAVGALAGLVVLDPLARERLGHLARRLLGGEDERHVAAEDALEDRADQRVVRAAEDDGVDARAP